MIKFKCDNCGQEFKVDDKYAGKKGKCHKCEMSIAIPKQVDQKVTQNQHVDSISGEVVEEASKKTSQILQKIGLVTLFVVVLGVIIIFLVQEHIKQEKASAFLSEWNATKKYFRELGLDSPSHDFKEHIPAMEDLLRQTQAVEIELKAISRNLEVGANYNEYKTSILKLGIVYDSIFNIPDCHEAGSLARKAESALSSHKYALDSWGRYVKYNDYKYKTERDERINEALKVSRKFLDYCDYIRIAIKYKSQLKT